MTVKDYRKQAGDKNVCLYSINKIQLDMDERYDNIDVMDIEETKTGVNVTINLLKL